MRKFILILVMLFCFITPSFSAVTLVKAVSMTQLSLDESVVNFHLDTKNKIGIIVTTKNLYIVTDPLTAGAFYTIEKVALPVFAADEKITFVYWNDITGKPTALATNKNIYFFLYS